MRARITQGIARRLAKLLNPLLDAEAKAVAKQREHKALTKEQQLSIARYYMARTYGVESLAPSEREQLTLAQRTVLGFPKIASVGDWERTAMDSQQRLMEEARK